MPENESDGAPAQEPNDLIMQAKPPTLHAAAALARRTRSCPSACRMARVRQLCAFCSVRVACVAAIFFSAVRTSCTVRSFSKIVPMAASSGRSESRFASTVLAVRPGSL